MIHRSRRLQDTMLVAAHRACDGGHLDIAAKLLHLTEEVMAAEPDIRRRRQEMWTLIAAHERLWHLRHPDADLPPEDAPIETITTSRVVPNAELTSGCLSPLP